MTQITADTTWACPDGPRVVSGRVIVAGPLAPTLTIEPGCEVLFEKDGELVIGTESEPGILAANGTASSPIVLGSAAASPQPGDWKGIRFHFDSRNSRIEHTRIENCGGDAERVASCVTVFGDANATPADCQPTVSSLWLCTGPRFYGVHVRGSAGHGFAFLDNSTFTLDYHETLGVYGFSKCRVEATASYPVLLEPNAIPNIPHDLELVNGANSKFRVTGGIWYRNGGLPRTTRLKGSTFEPSAEYAYSFAGEVRIERHFSHWGGDLSLFSGVELEFDAAAGLVVGSADRFGSLTVNRPQSANAAVKLTSGAVTPLPGSWRGVVIEAQGQVNSSPWAEADEVLIIEYAGAMSRAALTCNDCTTLSLYGATFRNNLHDAVLLDLDDAAGPKGFTYLRGHANGGHLLTYPIEAFAKVFLQSAPMTTGSGASIRLLGGKVTKAMRLPELGLPYVIDGDVVVSGPTGPTPYPRLEVFDATLAFTPGSSLQIGGVMNEVGYITVWDTVLTSATNPAPGAWDGIVVDSISASFERVTIEHGGKADGSGANLTFLRDPGAAPRGISNSTIRSSSGCGIRRVGTFTTDFTSAERANVFSSNVGGNQCGP